MDVPLCSTLEITNKEILGIGFDNDDGTRAKEVDGAAASSGGVTKTVDSASLIKKAASTEAVKRLGVDTSDSANNEGKGQENHAETSSKATESSTAQGAGEPDPDSSVTPSDPQSTSSNGESASDTDQLKVVQRINSTDEIEDSIFDPIQADPDSCDPSGEDSSSCWSPPATTIDEEEEQVTTLLDTAQCSYGGVDPDQNTAVQREEETTCRGDDKTENATVLTDRHWGSDPTILRMRDKLRESGSGKSSPSQGGSTSDDESNDSNSSRSSQRKRANNRRPPIFLMPGLASTRLVAWRFKKCPQSPFLSDIKILDNGTLLLPVVAVDRRHRHAVLRALSPN